MMWDRYQVEPLCKGKPRIEHIENAFEAVGVGGMHSWTIALSGEVLSRRCSALCSCHRRRASPGGAMLEPCVPCLPGSPLSRVAHLDAQPIGRSASLGDHRGRQNGWFAVLTLVAALGNLPSWQDHLRRLE